MVFGIKDTESDRMAVAKEETTNKGARGGSEGCREEMCVGQEDRSQGRAGNTC